MRSVALLLGALVLLATSGAAFAVDAELRKMAEDADSFKRSDAARALAKEGTPAAAKILTKLLADENPYVRDHTVNACAKVTDDGAVEVLAGAAKGRDERLRTNVAAALGETESTVALPTLRKLATEDRSAAVRRAALDALWGFRENADALDICNEAYGDDDAAVRAAAVEAAGRVGGEGCLFLIQAALADKDLGVRCVARMELPFVTPEGAATDLAASIEKPEWQTRQQLVENAYRMMDGASLEALVTLVADERLRVAEAAHRALVEITGKQLGRDRDIWRSWWAANSEGWKAPGKRPGGEVPASSSTSSPAVYHGVEITSTNVVFVIDASGSMRDEISGGKSGWDLAREELERAVAALPDGTRVNAVVFQEEANVAFSDPKALGKKSRKQLASFLKRVSPGERGNLLAGVLAGLAQDDVDSLYLLSDGAPSHGDHTLKNRVADAIRSVNRTRKIAIHTIGFGAKKGSERSFLKRLATDSMARCKLD